MPLEWIHPTKANIYNNSYHGWISWSRIYPKW